jgi:hypothetical protein
VLGSFALRTGQHVNHYFLAIPLLAVVALTSRERLVSFAFGCFLFFTADVIFYGFGRDTDSFMSVLAEAEMLKVAPLAEQLQRREERENGHALVGLVHVDFEYARTVTPRPVIAIWAPFGTCDGVPCWIPFVIDGGVTPLTPAFAGSSKSRSSVSTTARVRSSNNSPSNPGTALRLSSVATVMAPILNCSSPASSLAFKYTTSAVITPLVPGDQALG